MSRDALIVGINTYRHLQPLTAPANDAEAIAQRLKEKENFEVWRLPEYHDIWDNNARKVAQSQEVTLKQLEAALEQLFLPKGKHPPQTALFYFSGHGLRKGTNILEGFLATSDVDPEQDKWGLSLEWLQKLLRRSSIPQQIVWIDCCYSGELLNLDDANPGNEGKASDRCFIAACREFELSWQDVDGFHSSMTRVLVEGLDTLKTNGRVDNLKLTSFINDHLSDTKQRPLFYNTGGVITLIQGNRVTSSTTQQGLQSNVCPYKGLEAFGTGESAEEDYKFFFGRTALVDELLDNIRQRDFLAILGPSGSGKSSVVRAGLLHQLKAGTRIASQDWTILVMHPGANPLQNLARAFIPNSLPEGQAKTFRSFYVNQLRDSGLEGLRSIITNLEAPTVVLVIDQFEELFTLCSDLDERRLFLNCLVGALGASSREPTEPQPLKIVLTMRADFLGNCADYRELALHIQQGLVTVTPMTIDELTQAIEEPARQVGLEIDASLVTKIIHNIHGSPGYLPLLQFALKKLWEQRDTQNHCLTSTAYDAMGGVMGALNRHADQIYNHRDYNSSKPAQKRTSREQEWIRRIFLKLIRTGEGMRDVRQPQPKQKLLAIARNSSEEQKALGHLLDQLIQGRLLTSVTEQLPQEEQTNQELEVAQTEPVIALAHEALMNAWEKFAGWREVDRKLIRLRDRLEDAFKIWQTEGCQNENLLMGGLLNQVRENWLDLQSHLDSTAIDFYQRSDCYETEQASSQAALRQKLLEVQERLEKLRLQTAELESRRTDYVAALRRFDERMKSCREAASWVKQNQTILVQNAANASTTELAQGSDPEDFLNLTQQFQQDVGSYLDWLHTSLQRGGIIPLDNTDLRTPLIANPRAYLIAFLTIKQEVRKANLPVSVVTELEGMLSYLINRFSPVSFGVDTD